MRIRELMLVAVTSGLFLGSQVQGDSSSNSHDKRHKSHKRACVRKDPIVGTYTLSVVAFGTPGYASISFDAGGTLHGMDSFDIGQPLLPNFPNGLSLTVWTGNWKKIGCRTYSIFFTNVAFVQGESCCPTNPFARLKIEGTVTLSKNGKQLSSKLMVSFWDLDDLTLNTVNIVPPTPFPVSGLRVGN